VYAVIGVIAAAAVVAVVLAAAGGPIVLAILPLVLGAGVLVLFQTYKRRETEQRMTELRQEAETDTNEFTARDRETQA
jgi:hypothetical protein